LRSLHCINSRLIKPVNEQPRPHGAAANDSSQGAVDTCAASLPLPTWRSPKQTHLQLVSAADSAAPGHEPKTSAGSADAGDKADQLSRPETAPGSQNNAAELAQSLDQKLIECLRPVDWASLSTLARLTGAPPDDIIHHLHRLESLGLVGLGRRLVPPEMRTVAWVVRRSGPNGSRS